MISIRTQSILLVFRTIIFCFSLIISFYKLGYCSTQRSIGSSIKSKSIQEVSDKKYSAINLSDLINEAKLNNPQIKAAYQNYLAMAERITQAVSLEDPKIKIGYFIENAETKVGPQRAKYGISQKFPSPGKLTLRGRVAEKEKDIAYQNYKAIELEIVKELKKTYFELYWIRKSIEITREIKELLQTLEKVAESKYATGVASQQDVLKAQVEISKLMDRLLVLEKQEVTQREKINTLLNRPVESPLGEIADFEPTDMKFLLNELFDIAKEFKQELRISELQVKRFEAIKSLKKKDYVPDITLGVDFLDIASGHTNMSNDGTDAWLAMAKINIPIWLSRIKAGVKEAENKLTASQKVYKDIKNKVLFQIKDLHFKLKTQEELVNLYKTALVPQAEESFKAALASYETGKTDFLNIIDSERVLLNFKIAYFKAIADYEKAIAELERAIGIEFRDLEVQGRKKQGLH